MLSEIVKRNRFLSSVHWWLLQCGLDLRTMGRAVQALPRYFTDLRRFSAMDKGELRWWPSLHDRYEDAGAVGSEYFWQDLYVARKIFDAKPIRHVDVGSRIDGFVAHVASFRIIEVFDIRPITASIPNVSFRQVDLMSPDIAIGGTPSLSCLHALEHFGLGRYGDPLSTDGHLKGLRSLAALLAPNGVFYLSCPVGRPRVEFNSHRILDPVLLVDEASRLGLALDELSTISPLVGVRSADISPAGLRALTADDYTLAIYTFRKSV